MSIHREERSRDHGISRRSFIQRSAGGAGAWIALASQKPAEAVAVGNAEQSLPASSAESTQLQPLDLGSARWIWYPSGRTLPNTFVLLRRVLHLPAKPVRAIGWVSADSRYLLRVNGQRVGFGPAPCDPRWIEADPIEVTSLLAEGDNVFAATVLSYGHGDGTSAMGKPGFLMRLDLEMPDGSKQTIVSDASWQAHLARAWRRGQYKRWYLRSLQEDFDARLYPHGWETAREVPASDWLPAMVLDCPTDKPPVCAAYSEYALDIQGDRSISAVRPRTIPALREVPVGPAKLAEAYWLRWKRDPEEYFSYLTPDCFETERLAGVEPGAQDVTLDMDTDRAAALTFELTEQVVGWPRFTIEAPAGTIVELMVHEAHKLGGPPLLNSHFHAWGRFTCKEGLSEFEAFDYESCRWIQLHIRNAKGRVAVRNVGMRRRLFPWPNEPMVKVSEPSLQRLMDATVNTLNNCAQETCVDGMGRERQQYSGDCGHQLHAIYMGFGEHRLPARYLRTFSQGMTLDGYFLDCWPGYDRLARLAQRQLQMTGWGPLLDHGVGFNFDCWHHYLYTGQLDALREPYPRLLRFADYLRSIRRDDGLLPVEDIGVPSVWIDHQGFARQQHKQCAFNLYAAAMLEHALAPICRSFGDDQRAEDAAATGRSLLTATVKRFWSQRHGMFVDNLPWLEQDKAPRIHDRSLATAVLFDQCPQDQTQASLKALANCPPEMGFSYPANAGWRLWALAKGGRGDIIMNDLRTRWAKMDSVLLNNTLQEDWNAAPDSWSQWSHCPVAPLYILYMSIAGIRPTAPGFARCEIRPQLADLESLELVAHTAPGPLRFSARGKAGDRRVAIDVPGGCQADLIVAATEQVSLESISAPAPEGHRRYRLPSGFRTLVHLKES